MRRLFPASHFGQYFEMPRSEDIVDHDFAIFAHGVVNISEIATFLPFLASETEVCKRSKTGNMHSCTLPHIGLRTGRNGIQAPTRTECGDPVVAAWNGSHTFCTGAIWEVVAVLGGCSRNLQIKIFHFHSNWFLNVFTDLKQLTDPLNDV